MLHAYLYSSTVRKQKRTKTIYGCILKANFISLFFFRTFSTFKVLATLTQEVKKELHK